MRKKLWESIDIDKHYAYDNGLSIFIIFYIVAAIVFSMTNLIS